MSSSIGIYCRCGIYIMGVKAMVGSTLDLISLFNILASTCLAHVAQTSILALLESHCLLDISSFT